MSNQRIVFTRPNGEVSVVGESILRTIEEQFAVEVPVGSINARIIDVSGLPSNRHYRNAWDDSNPENHVGIDAIKAGVIANKRRTDKRDEVFAPYRVITSKAAQGIPLHANENAQDAADEMTRYKTEVDDVAQVGIAAGVLADDIGAIEAAEIAAGLL